VIRGSRIYPFPLGHGGVKTEKKLPMKMWRVLIVEDEADSAEVIARILAYHEIQYVIASTAEEAVLLLEKDKNPTLMIIDLALPGMDGWALLNVVRSDPETARVPAVAVTAYHSPAMAQKALSAGFNAYFPKPLDPTSFVQELERVVSSLT
jgi:CheY-like chemotaxis protein